LFDGQTQENLLPISPVVYRVLETLLLVQICTARFN